jgi:hypothetical protein
MFTCIRSYRLLLITLALGLWLGGCAADAEDENTPPPQAQEQTGTKSDAIVVAPVGFAAPIGAFGVAAPMGVGFVGAPMGVGFGAAGMATGMATGMSTGMSTGMMTTGFGGAAMMGCGGFCF